MADKARQDTPTAKAGHDSLKSFSAYVDENGQNMGQDLPTERANAADLQAKLDSDPSGEAETARIASGRPSENATDATEAETPPENLRQISDPTLPKRA